MLILDTDGLIKLHRAQVLYLLADRYECAIPSAVYQEAVINALGKYPDAEQIDQIIQLTIKVVDVEVPSWVPGYIGLGEREVLALFNHDADTIISDDGYFLRHLTTQSIRFLSPTDLALRMVEQGQLATEDAAAAIDLLKPLIKADVYQREIDVLEDLGKR